MKLNVAIDGPAGAGKSTIAKILASHYNLMYINSGYMYRTVTYFALKNNISFKDKPELIAMIKSLRMYFDADRMIVNEEDITDEITMPEISKNVSNYASVSQVREILVELQRKISKNCNVVMDGRDIGTVVLNDAQFKFFLTASPEDRAHRRFKELTEKGLEVNYDNILQEIIQRDHIDSTRKINPLTKSKDAIVIDSSRLDISEVVDLMTKYIDGLI